jgi:DNA-binding LytR/AlgR family response regulator
MYLRGGFEQQLWFNRQRFISIISSQLRDEKPTFIVVGRSFIINLAYIFRINPVQSELVLFDSVKPEQMSLHASQEALNKLKKEILILNKVEDYER